MGTPRCLVLLAVVSQDLPPLSFHGFRAGMPVRQATALIESIRGQLTCRASTDARMRECTGFIPERGVTGPLAVLISSVHDSAAVIVLSGTPPADLARTWIEDLAIDFGRPDYSAAPATQHTWQWVRRGRMLRVIVRNPGDTLETSVTLTHGPLLDGLGPPERKKPD
jgi:hypothetical protein